MPFISDIPGDSWDEFNKHLSFDFYEIQIPIVPEEQWQMVAQLLAGDPLFADDGIPNGDNFSSWRDWGDQLLVTLNGED